MAQKLISIQDPNLIQSGIVKGMHKLQAPLWVDGQNVIFEDGAASKSTGYIAPFDPDGNTPITGLQDVLALNQANLIFGDNFKLYRYDGTTVTIDGTGYSGSLDRAAFQENAFQDAAFVLSTEPRASLWSMENWGSWALASNGVDEIQINKMLGAGFGDLTGTPPQRAEVIKKLKIYLLAFNTDLGGAYIEWCDGDNVEDWVNGAAGYLFVRDLDSDIICAQTMGDVVAFYTTNSMGIIQYIGPDFYFGARKRLTGIGATGKFSVIEFDSKNAGVSYQGIWVTDGTGYEYISPPFIREWLQKNVNWGSASKIAGYLNEDRSLLEWGLPIGMSSENNITLAYNYKTQGWTFRDYGITCGLKKNIFRFPIFGLSNGAVLYGEYSFDADGTALDAWVQSKPLDAGDAMQWKDIEYLIANFKSVLGEGLYIFIGVQDDLTDEIDWGSEINPGEASEPLFTDRLRAGRYISIKIGSNSVGSSWRFTGMDLFGAGTGGHI